jgi:hypothetical protein
MPRLYNLNSFEFNLNQKGHTYKNSTSKKNEPSNEKGYISNLLNKKKKKNLQIQFLFILLLLINKKNQMKAIIHIQPEKSCIAVGCPSALARILRGGG